MARSMASTLLLLLILGAALFGVLGVYGGFTSVSADAVEALEKLRVVVYPEGEQEQAYRLTLGASYVKVLHYHEGGVLLEASARPDTKWQLVVGFEDWSLDGQGDHADVIVKIWKSVDGHVNYEIAALGGWRKQIYYGDSLKLDTASSRYATWYV